MKALDLTGQIINNLKIIERDYSKKKGRTWWICECLQCNQRFSIASDKLKMGQKSCGCNKGLDLKGKKFGHLTVLEKINGTERRTWKCQCDCGAIVNVLAYSLTTGATTSCGCIKSKGEDIISRLLTDANIPYIREKTFDSCRFPDSNKKARFDFYVKDSYAIEYDG